jgi:uncharacterized integral membrane protein (TIGR00697 family)
MTNLALSTLIGLYCSLAVLAPILSNRLVQIGHFKIVLGGLFAALAASLLDVVNNNWGMKTARETVLAALLTRFIIYGLVTAAMFLPVVKETVGYQEMILTGIRLLLAAEISSAISQYFIDIPVFDYMKRKFKFFLFRYNLSNLISTGIQSVSFVYIGFWGTDKAHLIPHLIVGGLVLKLGFQLVLSPLMALLAHWTKPNVRTA